MALPYHQAVIERESSARRLSLSRTVRVCLLEYLKLKEELATSMTDDSKLGDEHTGKIIYTLLSRTEERIASTIQKLENRISEYGNRTASIFISTYFVEHNRIPSFTRYFVIPAREWPESSAREGENLTISRSLDASQSLVC